MKKKTILALLLVCALVMLSGCSLLSGETQPRMTPADDSDRPLTPDEPAAVNSSVSVTLYYEYLETGMLSTQTKTIENDSGHSLERCALEELIKGPDTRHSSLQALISENTEVISVEAEDGVLFVTLTDDILTLPAGCPENWLSDPAWRRAVAKHMSLALQSIVCTLTDLSTYTSVQLLISSGTVTGNGIRPQLGYFDAECDTSKNIPLGTVARDESIVLTPRTAVEYASSLIRGGEIDDLYAITAADSRFGARPAYEEFMSALNTESSALEFRTGDVMVSNDGQTATVCVTFAGDNGNTVAPVHLVREKEAWKITYPSLLALVEGCS